MNCVVSKIPRKSNMVSEPPELIFLKQLLAEVNSNCKNSIEKKGKKGEDPKECRHKDIQVTISTTFLKDLVKTIPTTETGTNTVGSSSREQLCPNCFLTLNLLRGGSIKILKDEENQTGKEASNSSDKATSWSNIIKPAIKYANTNYRNDSDSSNSDDTVASPPPKREVTFALNLNEEQDSTENYCEPLIQSIYEDKFDIDHYIESIRPPWAYSNSAKIAKDLYDINDADNANI